MTISDVPKSRKARCSVRLYKGGEVSLEMILIISGMDLVERKAEKASSPHRLAVNWFTIHYSASCDLRKTSFLSNEAS